MAFPGGGRPPFPPQLFQDYQFELFDWYPKFQSCLRYFLDHAQYSGPVQALAALVNIQLPFQRSHHPVLSSTPGAGPPSPLSGPGRAGSPASSAHPIAKHHPSLQRPASYASLVPYIRRLVATGFDTPSVLHGFFGDDWITGIGPLHEAERRNYLFAAKSDNWLKVKAHYDMADGQLVPFLRPLQQAAEKEIVAAETGWSEWLAMQDWMLGPRAPEGVRIKPEPE